MKFLIVATFKSNKTAEEVKDWLAVVSPVAATSKDEIVVAPSFVHLSLAQASISQLETRIYLSAQDVSPYPPGSYTGAVNAQQLANVGVTYCLVGHSERRHYFHETHADGANKVSELIGVGITPILCLSEQDIYPQLAALDTSHKDKIIYCFEPPSNIGGSESAPIEDIKRVVGLIRKSCDFPARVMYGGSVNAGNVESLRSGADIDGVLVSSASLDPESFIRILHRE